MLQMSVKGLFLGFYLPFSAMASQKYAGELPSCSELR